MSCSAKMRKLYVRIDADLKAAFEGTLRGIGVDPTCAMRSFAFQIVLEGSIPFDPVDAGFEAGGKTAVTSVKIPEDVAGEMESVLKGLGESAPDWLTLVIPFSDKISERMKGGDKGGDHGQYAQVHTGVQAAGCGAV